MNNNCLWAFRFSRWLKNRFLRFPFAPVQTDRNIARGGGPYSFSPFGDRRCDVTNRNPTVASSVSRLFFSCRPADVARLVVPIVIWVAVERHSRRAWADICQKRFETVTPFLAHPYATAAVVFVNLKILIVAALFSSSPGSIFARSFSINRVLMFRRTLSGYFSLPATTTLYQSFTQCGSGYKCLFATLAMAYPSHDAEWSILTPVEDEKTCKSLPSEINKIRHNHLRKWLLREKCAAAGTEYRGSERLPSRASYSTSSGVSEQYQWAS